MVPLIGGTRWYIIPQLAVYSIYHLYTTYIPLIYCQLAYYMLPIPPIFREPDSQPLKWWIFLKKTRSRVPERPRGFLAFWNLPFCGICNPYSILRWWSRKGGSQNAVKRKALNQNRAFRCSAASIFVESLEICALFSFVAHHLHSCPVSCHILSAFRQNI